MDLYDDVKIEILDLPIPSDAKKVIVTHSGKLHCDETSSCCLLTLLKEFQEAVIVRVGHTDIEEIVKSKKADVIVDIGGVYDVEKNIYDHHQKSFEETFSEDFETRLSSVGLIWKIFGKRVILEFAERIGIKELPEILVNKFHLRLYENFFEHIDADDNGIGIAEDPKFKIRTALPHRVANFNPSWNDPNPDPNKGFLKALNLVRKEFLENLRFYLEDWLPARSFVEVFWSNRLMDGKIMELKKFCPWKSHVYDLEEENKCEGTLLFTIFEEKRGNVEAWRYVCINKEPGSWENRVKPPESWCGLRGEELEKVSKIKGCTFVHKSGFTGGNWTKDGLLKMLEVSIEEAKEK